MNLNSFPRFNFPFVSGSYSRATSGVNIFSQQTARTGTTSGQSDQLPKTLDPSLSLAILWVMEKNDGNIVRFRLVFDDRHLLDKSQRSQGLSRCWFLFKPDITNIGDLASQIRECFGLRHRIVLFMDDFVLPSYESTCFIKDKDIIVVKKKEAKQKDIHKPCDDDMSQENLLGNGSYDKETLTSYVENAVHLDPPVVVGSQKRKRSKKHLDSKVKKKEAKQKDIHKPCDDGMSQENLLGNGSYDKEALTSYVENAVHLDPPVVIGSQKQKRSKKHLDSKNKEARRQMVSHSSDGEQNIASVDPLDDIHSEPREHGTQQAGETQVDDVPVVDGILPLPIPKVMSSAVDIMKPCKHVIHFEILLPLRRLPVKGDILAYRYIESSQLVHPQLSSPQVGEVSSFDCKTLQIVLLQVLDFTLLFDENPHGTIGQPNGSLYKEDGSLEIEYLSLVDVRLVKPHYLKEEKSCQDDQAKNDKWEEALLKDNSNDPNASTEEQSHSWAPWIPNKNATAMALPFKRPNVPFAGRGKGRTNWASNRLMNNWMTNKNTIHWNPNQNNAVWNPNQNNAVWNPNSSNARFTSTNNTATLPRLYTASGLPNPWERHQNNNVLPSGSFFGSEKQ